MGAMGLAEPTALQATSMIMHTSFAICSCDALKTWVKKQEWYLFDKNIYIRPVSCRLSPSQWSTVQSTQKTQRAECRMRVESGANLKNSPRNRLCDGPQVLYCTDGPFSSLVPHGRESRSSSFKQLALSKSLSGGCTETVLRYASGAQGRNMTLT